MEPERPLHPLPRGLVELYGLLAVLIVLVPEWLAGGALDLQDRRGGHVAEVYLGVSQVGDDDQPGLAREGDQFLVECQIDGLRGRVAGVADDQHLGRRVGARRPERAEVHLDEGEAAPRRVAHLHECAHGAPGLGLALAHRIVEDMGACWGAARRR